MGRGWARAGSVPPTGKGLSREWDTMSQGSVAVYPPRCVQPARGLCPQHIRGPDLARGPMSDGSNPARGCSGQNHSIIYHPRHEAVLGMGERLGGGHTDTPRPLSEEQPVLFLAGCHWRQRAVAVHTRRQTSSSY